MNDKISMNIAKTTRINFDVKKTNNATISMNGYTYSGAINYDKLTNRPQVNGITLTGNQTLVDLRMFSENTEDGWNRMPLYFPKAGEICLYTDINRIKIGDGEVPIVDLPFIEGADIKVIMDALREHEADHVIHVTAEDRARWDAKLNYTEQEENLIFTRN